MLFLFLLVIGEKLLLKLWEKWAVAPDLFIRELFCLLLYNKDIFKEKFNLIIVNISLSLLRHSEIICE